MLQNRIRPEIEKILWRNQNGFCTNRLTTGQLLMIRLILEGVLEKKPARNLIVYWLFKGLRYHRSQSYENNIIEIWHTSRNSGIMMLYEDT